MNNDYLHLTMSNVFKLFNVGIHFGGLLFVNGVAGRSTRYKFSESIINKGRNRNRLIGLRNLSPHLNGAAYFDFLQNVLNDPLNIIEELTASVMQTAENIRENPEMLVRSARLLWSEGHKPA
jgi:hypothetical protein